MNVPRHLQNSVKWTYNKLKIDIFHKKLQPDPSISPDFWDVHILAGQSRKKLACGCQAFIYAECPGRTEAWSQGHLDKVIWEGYKTFIGPFQFILYLFLTIMIKEVNTRFLDKHEIRYDKVKWRIFFIITTNNSGFIVYKYITYWGLGAKLV